MSSESESTEIQSVLQRLITSRNRDLSLFIPFLLGFNSLDSDHDSENHHDHQSHQRDRIILINPLTQGMVVIEGTRLDALFRNLPEKDGQPPASRSSVEAMPRVEIRDGDEGECVICLEEWMAGGIVKEMPCKHRFHGDCIEKWLGLHGSCPVCRHTMPVEEKKQGEEERENQRRREIWVSFSFGRRPEETVEDSHSGDQSEAVVGETSENQTTEERESETGN